MPYQMKIAQSEYPSLDDIVVFQTPEILEVSDGESASPLFDKAWDLEQWFKTQPQYATYRKLADEKARERLLIEQILFRG